MEPLAIVRERLRRQRLVGGGFASAAEAVAWLLAVQAQEPAEARWALGQRVPGCDEGAVDAAIGRGELVRTHALRPTWHFIAAADLRWLMRLTSPRVHAGNRSRYRDLGLDGPTLSRAHDLLGRALADGEPRTRRELGAALEADGLSVEGQRLPHILMHAEVELLLCSGPPRGREHTYALVDKRVPPEPGPPRSREAALAEFAVRYFRSHGPATVRDLVWWSSLTTADARTGIAAAGDALVSTPDAEGRTWITTPPPATAQPTDAGARFLSTFDESVVAYRDLRNVLRDGDQPSTALLTRPVVIDGRTVGTWRRTLRRDTVTVEITPDAPLDARDHTALEAEAARFGHFVGRTAHLSVALG